MSARNQSVKDKARARLLEHWQRKPEYGEPIGCLATTYTFDPQLFEDECLGRFAGLQCDPNESPRAYLVEREEKLSQIFSGVMVDQSHAVEKRSLRWELFSIRLRNGIQHAKISLLVWDQLVRVVVGSANLTERGQRSNIEQQAVLDFTPAGETPQTVFTQVIEFLEVVASNASGTAKSNGPKRRLRGFLRSAKQKVLAWNNPATKREEPRIFFLPVGPDGPDLTTQLSDAWTYGPVAHARVVSPFFDENGKTTIAAISELLFQRGERYLHITAAGRELQDGRVEMDAPAWLGENSGSKLKTRLYLVEQDHGDASRNLHAKCYSLEIGSRLLMCVGSSNFTSPGLGAGEGRVNFEANIAFVFPDKANKLALEGAAAFPRCKEVDSCKINFLGNREDPDACDGFDPLPEVFGEALLITQTNGLAVRLELLGEPPPGCALLDTDRRALRLPALKHFPGAAIIRLKTARPPSALIVTWTDVAGERCEAIWPINAEDSNALPPPEALASLTLEELLEILTSVQPAYEVVERIAKRKKKSGAIIADLDPHKRVDTSQFLLKRMHRISEALEQLKTRLEAPASSIDTFRWRLLGPLGPIALVDRLIREELQAPSFMLAEVALVLGDIRPAIDDRALARECRRLVNVQLTALEKRVRTIKAPENLKSYVIKAFSEVRR